MGLMDAIGRMLHISRNLNKGHPRVKAEDFNKAYDLVEELVAAQDEEIARLKEENAELRGTLSNAEVSERVAANRERVEGEL